MNITRYISPRTIIIAVFLSCVFFATVAEASTEDTLAAHWQHVKGSLPHDKIPSDPDKLKQTSKWAMPYAVSIVKIIGLGFVIAFLSLLIGIGYGIFKILRACCRKLCCAPDDEESGQSDTEEDETTFKRHWCPTIGYVIAWIFVLTGMAIGLQSNPRFSTGVDLMGDSVVTVGNDAISLGNGLLSGVEGIVSLIPATINNIEAQFSGVNDLANVVETLSNNVNATSTQVSAITTEVAGIDAGNTSSVAQLYSQLAAINNQSVQIIGSMSKLTGEVSDKLKTTFNQTIGSLDSKVNEIDSTVDKLVQTAQNIIKQASDLVKKVVGYVNDAKSYDKSRAKGVTALFVLVIFVPLVFAILGFIFKIKALFNVITGFSFVFLFFLWLSGSIHFLLGMALYDACPVVDDAVQGLLPSGTASTVLQGCLYDDRTVLQSLNISAYNLSGVFDYKSQFSGFSDFSKTFNFTAIDSYFQSISTLYQYNLSAVADNMTVANFGWNQSYIYTALDGLNNQTYPDYYDLSNYTNADPSTFSPPKNQTVYDAKTSVTNLLALNQTIYNKTAVARTQLYAAQDDINGLVTTMGALQTQFDGIKSTIKQLQTQNITNCIGYLDYLQANITGFFALGNCSFLGEQFDDIKGALCETMQPAIDCLTVGQFLAGLAIIPILIIAEVLSFRWPKSTFVNPFRGSDDGDSGYSSKKKEEKEKNGYAIAMTESPAARRNGLTATIGAAAPTSSAESSPASTPDFNANRRLVTDQLTNRDMRYN